MDDKDIGAAVASNTCANKPKSKRVKIFSVVLAVVLALGLFVPLMLSSKQAYAGTTDTWGDYYQLYNTSPTDGRHSKISHLRVDGNSAFCVELHAGFVSGINVVKHNAVDIYGQARVTEFALYKDYIYSISWLSDDQRYFIAQTMIWEVLEGGRAGDLKVDMGVSAQNQENIKAEARAYYQKYKNSYVGHGIFWDAGNAQNLGEFWVERHTLGSIKLKKASSDPASTDGNSRYSLAGAIYTIYNTDSVAVGTLAIEKDGNSNTVSNLWAGEFGTYFVKETKPPTGYKKNPKVYTVNLTSDGQVIEVKAEDEPILGRIELVKTSANPDMTNGNASYRLSGAEFGVFKSEADAKKLKNVFKKITTNNSGFGAVEGVPLGAYWIREMKAPEGYSIDSTIHYVDVTLSATTVNVKAQNRPMSDPIAVLLQKVDADTGLAYSGSDKASLAGAEFTVNYYDAQHKTVKDVEADTPTRSWVFKTDLEGYVLFDDDYLIAGDALYKNSAGDASIPIGTFTVQETKAPTGYLLSTLQYPNAKRIFHIFSDGTTDGEFLYVYNEQEVREQIVRGDIEIVKYQEDEVATPDMPSELKTPEAGVTFDLYASRDFTGTTPKSGAKPAFSITTDEEGVASTIDVGTVMMQLPDGAYTTRPRTVNDSGALPYDTYLVIQRDAPSGYSPANAFTVKVDKDKVERTYIVGNVLIASAIRIEKLDSETGVSVPYPATWQIIDAKTDTPISMSVRYPETQVLDTFTSNSEGWLLLPEMLPYGSYLLHEVDAPNDGRIGYLINPADVSFDVTKYLSWDNPLVVTFKDAPAKGQISLVKHDELSGALVSGAEYCVLAANDIYTLDGTLRYKAGEVVDALITDGDDAIVSRELYLGEYLVKEIKTADGYALNPEVYSAELVWQGQTASVNIVEVNAIDTPTTVEIYKTDAKTGGPLIGVTFAFEASDGTITELVTDADGRCVYPYLSQGSYKIYEVATAPGYILSAEVHEVIVDENGLIDGQAVCEMVFTNDFTKVEIEKSDIATGEPVIGATLQIFALDTDGYVAADPMHEWVTTGKPNLIERLPQGNYILREALAPSGYVKSNDVPFSVDDTGEIQRVSMQDDFTKVEISKTDIVTGKPVVGATLQIFPIDSDGKIVDTPLHEWVTTDEPYMFERLPQGDYILREISAPSGYVVSQDVAFTVSDTGEIQKVVMEDDFTKVEIIKLDAATGKVLAGATLQIIDADGSVFHEWLTTTEPYLIERLPQGEYTLHEVTAPKGYELAKDVTFTVKDTKELHRVEMRDEPTVPLDQTGRDGSLPFVAVGILAFVALGGILFALTQMRKRKSGKDEREQK